MNFRVATVIATTNNNNNNNNNKDQGRTQIKQTKYPMSHNSMQAQMDQKKASKSSLNKH